ncbi:MAG: septum formation initiator family protein, partial [Elusimicrobiota bacterium]
KSARGAAAASFIREHWAPILIGGGLFAVFFANAGFRSLIGNWRELRRLRADISRLQVEEKELDGRLRRLRADDGGVERVARKELSYIKKGEIEYRFPPPEKK